MAAAGQCAEIVRVRPKSGAEPRLLELRDALVDSYRQRASSGFVNATLIRPEDGDTWVDIWVWTDRTSAEASLADPSPEFVEWAGLVEIVQFEWADILADQAA